MHSEWLLDICTIFEHSDTSRVCVLFGKSSHNGGVSDLAGAYLPTFLSIQSEVTVIVAKAPIHMYLLSHTTPTCPGDITACIIVKIHQKETEQTLAGFCETPSSKLRSYHFMFWIPKPWSDDWSVVLGDYFYRHPTLSKGSDLSVESPAGNRAHVPVEVRNMARKFINKTFQIHANIWCFKAKKFQHYQSATFVSCL